MANSLIFTYVQKNFLALLWGGAIDPYGSATASTATPSGSMFDDSTRITSPPQPGQPAIAGVVTAFSPAGEFRGHSRLRRIARTACTF